MAASAPRTALTTSTAPITATSARTQSPSSKRPRSFATSRTSPSSSSASSSCRSSLSASSASRYASVETQTNAFEQFHASLHGFSRDLRRVSGRGVGYNSHITSHFGGFFNSDRSLGTGDFGCTGRDLGCAYGVPSGKNWGSRPQFPVETAYSSARAAVSRF